MTRDDLVGCLYPIKNENGIIVAYRRIVDCFDIENQAGFFIILSNNKSGVTSPYSLCFKLRKTKYESDSSFEVDPKSTVEL